MAEPNREFGDLLTKGLKSIVARENKPMAALEDELASTFAVRHRCASDDIARLDARRSGRRGHAH